MVYFLTRLPILFGMVLKRAQSLHIVVNNVSYYGEADGGIRPTFYDSSEVSPLLTCEHGSVKDSDTKP